MRYRMTKIISIDEMKETLNECLGCGCYDEDVGCTMPSIDKWYACPLYADEDELKEMFERVEQLDAGEQECIH